MKRTAPSACSARRARRRSAWWAAVIAVMAIGTVHAQGGASGPPGPSEPEWGAYRSGLGYPVFSDDLQDRADEEGIDPRCLMTITIAWQANPSIVANVENGLLEVLVEGVPRAEAQAVLMAESPYFNGDIDCAGTPPATWQGGTYSSTYGNIDFGAGDSGRGVYEGGDSAIIYAMIGRVMTGFWVEPASSMRCDSSVGGSEYWGRIRFEFDEEFGGWSGTWGYCDEDPERTWTGSRAE